MSWRKPAGFLGWHEPYESRDSRPDLWEARGEIPRAYPATGNRAKPNRTEATTRKLRQCHRETKTTAPVLDSTPDYHSSTDYRQTLTS